MLKRRPSKRFVLAESGQDSSWDASTDNDPNINATINVENVSSVIQIEAPQQNSQPIVEAPSEPPAIVMKHLALPSQDAQGLK